MTPHPRTVRAFLRRFNCATHRAGLRGFGINYSSLPILIDVHSKRWGLAAHGHMSVNPLVLIVEGAESLTIYEDFWDRLGRLVRLDRLDLVGFYYGTRGSYYGMEDTNQWLMNRIGLCYYDGTTQTQIGNLDALMPYRDLLPR